MRRDRRVCRGGDRDGVGGQTIVWRAYLPSGLPWLQGEGEEGWARGKAKDCGHHKTVEGAWGIVLPKAPATPRGSRALGGSLKPPGYCKPDCHKNWLSFPSGSWMATLGSQSLLW